MTLTLGRARTGEQQSLNTMSLVCYWIEYYDNFYLNVKNPIITISSSPLSMWIRTVYNYNTSNRTHSPYLIRNVQTEIWTSFSE